MTLIMSVAYKDEFAFITSDSRVIKQSYRLSDFKRTDKKAEKAEISCEKAIKLTDFVLFSSGGNAMLGELIEDEMKKRITSDSDLSECTSILRNIIQEFRERKGKNNQKGLLNKPSLSLNFLDVPEYFGCCMTGFYKNGGTGMTTFGSGKDTVPEENFSSNESYPIFLFAPTNDYQEMGRGYFILPTDKQTINDFLDTAVILHATISYVQSNAVSPDCNAYILLKKPNKIKPEFVSRVIDTEPFHKSFPDVTEVERMLNPK